ncbi:MAG TPA: hypothetical protein VLT62_03925 [Candidatus Methylomirabilis sp.]|nr:hypothetical protein [Candidatus Methylomirabilis sp.]
MSLRARYLGMTLALVATGLGAAVFQQWPRRDGLRPPARAEASPTPASRPKPLPTARDILDRGAALALTAEQAARLAALEERWKQESATVQTAAEEAGRGFSQFLKEQGSARTSLQEIQRRSADYRELSQELRELRRRHAEAAGAILTESQQRKYTLLTSPDTRGGVQ